MSGLETFGLVCNVMTVITFARDTIALCKAVYQGNSPDRQLLETALSLKTVSLDLQDCCQTTSAQTVSEKRLADIAKRCHEAAAALEDEVGFITGNIQKGSLAATLGVAVKTNWRRRHLDRLQSVVGACKSELETSLLGRIWYDVAISQCGMHKLLTSNAVLHLRQSSSSKAKGLRA